MTSMTVHNDRHFAQMFHTLEGLKMPFTVSWKQGYDRTQAQNRWQFRAARLMADHRGDVDTAEVQAEWKLDLGVPIMRAEDDEFREMFDLVIAPQTRETKLRLMRMGYPVTRLMKSGQMTRYMEFVVQECAAWGVDVTPWEDK